MNLYSDVAMNFWMYVLTSLLHGFRTTIALKGSDEFVLVSSPSLGLPPAKLETPIGTQTILFILPFQTVEQILTRALLCACGS